MKKIFLVIALSLSLAGCATLEAVTNGISLATKTIANPVTKTEEAQVELALDSAIQVLLTYKRACAQGSADKNCRANVSQIQAYTRQIPPLVAQLRTFVDNNDQVNATVVYNQLTALYANIRAASTTLGISTGA